jgi:hypothetical protein
MRWAGTGREAVSQLPFALVEMTMPVERHAPTLSDETAKDGALEHLGEKRQQIPFDFAQGRLFADDNLRGNSNIKSGGNGAG